MEDHSQSQEDQHASSNASSGWGGWFSSKPAATQPSASSTAWGFGSLLSSVTESAQSIATAASRIVSPIEEMEIQHNSPSQVDGQDSSNGEDTSNLDTKSTSETLHVDPFATIGSLVGSSVGALGSFVQTNQILDSFTQTVGSMAQTSFEASRQIASVVVDKIEHSTIYEHGVLATQVIAIQSLDAVEVIGKTAMDLLIPNPLVDSDDESEPKASMETLESQPLSSESGVNVQTQDISGPDSGKRIQDQTILSSQPDVALPSAFTHIEGIADHSLEEWIEKLQGNIKLKDVETLSNDYLLKTRKLSATTKPPSEFEQLFVIEGAEETDVSAPENIGSTSTKVLDLCKVHSQELLGYASLATSSSAAEADDYAAQTDITHAMDVIHRSARKALAEYSVACVSEMSTHLNEFCKTFDERKDASRDRVLGDAIACRSFVLFANQGLTEIAELHVAVLRHIIATCKAIDAHAIHIEEYLDKSKTTTASIYLDCSDASGHVQKALESSQQIFRYLWICAKVEE